MNQPAERVRFSEGGQGGEGQGGSVDVEGMARRAGWKPKDDWVSDGNAAEKWVDANVFVERVLSGYDKRGQDRYRAMDSRLAAQERTIQQMSGTISESAKVMQEFQTYHQGVAKREYERAKKEIEARMRSAVKDADPEAHDAARADLVELEKTKPADPPPTDATKPNQQTAPDPTIVTWNKDNLWYNPTGTDELSMWAVGYFNNLPATLSLQEKLDKLSERAVVLFPDETKGKLSGKYADLEGGDRQQRRTRGKVADPDVDSDGDGDRGGAGQKGRRFEDLPKEAQEQCRAFEKQMVPDPKNPGKMRPLVSRAQYLADYDWS